ncbi:hypothetical protein ZOSMA_10G00960 [Zostera marina]|uniref:Uncharacterized protein n=1 Tax=Zostera marina TaxID=29655 RepID=A0A0K9Q3G8_ZOSMR|nr:hypothetical protein ZOSMA_10G00960 [Zostera marina]
MPSKLLHFGADLRREHKTMPTPLVSPFHRSSVMVTALLQIPNMGASFELVDGWNEDRQSKLAGGNSDRACVPTGRDESGSEIIQDLVEYWPIGGFLTSSEKELDRVRSKFSLGITLGEMIG